MTLQYDDTEIGYFSSDGVYSVTDISQKKRSMRELMSSLEFNGCRSGSISRMKGQRTMVSIIVPIYNREKTICRCLDSLLLQSYKNYEVIIVDDGSTDLTGEICERYARFDQRIRVVHVKNGGPAAARNKGMDIAQGDFIMFCDSDDYPHSDWVEVLVSYMKDEDTVMSTGGFNIVKENGSIKPFIPAQTGPLPVKEFVLQRERLGLYYVWHSCYRKSAVRFDESLHLGEDAIYNLEYIRLYLNIPNAHIACTDYCVYDYYQDTVGSLSKDQKERMLFWKELRRANESFIANYPYNNEDMEKIQYMLFQRECTQFFKRAEHEASLMKLKELMSSEYWDRYCQSMNKSSRWTWLYKKKSIPLFYLYYRVYYPIRRMVKKTIVK